ncbi:MAG: hypothetical protein ACYTG2_00065 [Planctomycetota bacterium]|jgi:hypothetical protein
MTLDTTHRGPIQCAILLAVTVLCGPVVAQQGFQHAVPEDTLVFLGIDDVTAYGEDWSQSALGSFWTSERMRPTRDSIASDIDGIRAKLEEEVGADLLRFPGMIDGPFAFALLDFEMPREGMSDEPSVAVCMLADVGQQRDECQLLLDRLMEKVRAEADEVVIKQEEVADLEVTAIVSTDPHDDNVQVRFAFHEQTLVVLLQTGDLSRDPFLRMADGLDGRADSALAGSSSFRSSLAAGQHSGVRLYADVGRILDSVFVGVEASEGPDSVREMMALGLDQMGVLSMNLQCGEDGSTAAMRLDWPGDGWVPQIMRHLCAPGSFPAARYVPAEARSFTAFNADLPGMFDTVSRMLIDMKAITPTDLVQFLTETETDLGFNPRDDLLELFTGEFVLVTDDVDPSEALPIVTGDSTNFALIVGLHDGDSFTTLLDGLVRKTGFHVGRKSEEFQGFQVYQVPMPITTISLGYAVLDDMAVISLSPTMLRDILRRRASSDLPTMIGTDKYLEAIQRVGPEHGMIAFSDTASDMKQLLRTLRTLPDLVGEAGGENGPLEWLKALPLPDDSLIDEHFSGGTVSVCTIDENGITFESAGP